MEKHDHDGAPVLERAANATNAIPTAPPGIAPGESAAGQAGPAVRSRVELPTLALAVVIHAAWGTATFFHDSLSWWLLLPLGATVAAWHAGLQHEAIHGHPTRHRGLNIALVWWPILLWLPYRIYERTHLRHHHDPDLTDPFDDPESFYVTESAWRTMSPAERAARLAMNCLVGRLIIGPFFVVFGFLWREAARLGRGDTVAVADWLLHVVAAAPVLLWLTLVAEMPLTRYLVFFVLPGTSLVLLRSFLEHRPAAEVGERTAIVEDRGLLSLIYLNNNLHALHHARPGLPWYALRAHYAAAREDLADRNGGYVFSSYLNIVRAHGLWPKDHPVHPFRR